jgi:predicted phage baseplate assembly protein
VERLRDAGPADRVYVTRTDELGVTTVSFGDGRNGARPPSGQENVRARFRVGLGTAGNVAAGQVMILTQPPPGVRAVTNPLDATGGADPEGVDRARRNAPLGTLTLGRVVSVADYAAFARTFAGIGKAESVLLTAGGRQLIQVTVAASDDAALAPDSDLMANLTQALARNAKARLPFRLDPRERVFVFLGAGVRLDPDYDWANVRPQLRAALVAAFPFEERGMGRGLFLSEVVSVLQSVGGVVSVEVDYFFGVEERRPGPAGRVLRSPDEIKREVGHYTAVPGLTENNQPVHPDRPPVSPVVPALPAGVEGGAVRPAQIAYFGPETLDELKATVSFRLIRT